MQQSIFPLLLSDALTRPSPAPYSAEIVPVLARMLKQFGFPFDGNLLDPMAGTGRIYRLASLLPTSVQIFANELEPEWAAHDRRTIVGDARSLPWPDGFMDAVCVSPPYGNRLADAYVDHTKRITYRAYLQRPLTEGSAAGMQWGKKYRATMREIWTEARRVLQPTKPFPDGIEYLTGWRPSRKKLFVLNCKNHYRDFKLQYVTEWHIECLESLGFKLLDSEQVEVPSARYGENYDSRVPFETVAVFKLEV